MSISELKRRLSAIEPDESIYAGVGSAEIPLLEQLLNGQEAWLAARAVYALARIDATAAHAALGTAARSPRAEVRVAVAANTARLPARVSDTLLPVLLADSSAGVRKFAVKSVSDHNDISIRAKLKDLASSDSDPAIRTIARDRSALLSP